MSTHATHAASHGHGHDHVPHVLPLKTYIMTWGALMVLTVITVAVSYVDFGSFNLVVALAVAATKASIVALVFMHLWFDSKFNGIIFVSSLVFLAIFIAFTMFDTESRGVNNAAGLTRPADITNPFGGTVEDKAIQTKWEAMKKAEPAAPAALPAEKPAEPAPQPKPDPAPEEKPAAEPAQ